MRYLRLNQQGNMRLILLVGLGGFLGSVTRYLTAVYFTKLIPSLFPYGTFFINISGSFLIGVIYGLSERYNWPTSEWRIFLTTGFCGGYTTFSAFSYENIKLIESGNYLTFITYSSASVIAGIVAAFIGLAITKINFQ